MVREAVAGGAEPLNFSYETDNTTTVTDGLGVSRTFSLSSIQGVKRVTSSSLPCPGCAASGIWDSQTGLPILTYDFNGQITSYGYDSQGRETSRQDGGPIAEGHRTVSTQWHDALHLPVRIASPSRITTFAYDAQGNLASKSEHP